MNLSYYATIDCIPLLWPDIGVKCSPNSPKSCQKSRCSSTYIRVKLFKLAQKFANHLGHFVICWSLWSYKICPIWSRCSAIKLSEGKFFQRLSLSCIFWYHDQCDQIWRFFALWATFLKPLATINLHKSLTFLCIFCKGVKIYHFSSAFIFGQLL